MSSVPSDQETLDDLLITRQKVIQGVAIEYTEAGERIRLPKLSELDESIRGLRRAISQSNSGSVFLVQPNGRL